MDNANMIQRLQHAGVTVEAGMTEAALDRAEAVFGFRFPREIRAFLACGVPVGRSFFDYRDVSAENQERFRAFQTGIEESFRFDLENNRGDVLAMLGERLGFSEDAPGFDEAVMDDLQRSVKLIPFYAHRCFFDGMDDMPILSFWQAVDTIVYGVTFENYLRAEFLGETCAMYDLPERMVDTGMWNDIVA